MLILEETLWTEKVISKLKYLSIPETMEGSHCNQCATSCSLKNKVIKGCDRRGVRYLESPNRTAMEYLSPVT